MKATELTEKTASGARSEEATTKNGDNFKLTDLFSR